MSEIEPDAKDWTWVLQRPCPECGFEAATVGPHDLGRRIRDNAALWGPLLATPAATSRPGPTTWSPTEYAAHVRDVHRVFTGRLQAVLTQDRPEFADWDQDATAIAEHYASQDPADVAPALLSAAHDVAAIYDAVPDDGRAWDRPGRRSNGSEFTTLSLGRYHLHDLVHHAWDVRGAVAAATVAAYEGHAEAYRGGAPALSETMLVRLDDFAARAGADARVLEVGSGSGRDAAHLETRGLSVRRSDVTPAFVALMRAEGRTADIVDPLLDDLTDPARPTMAYDGVWANACLLHVARTDLPRVLVRLAAATRRGGVLWFSVKEGDGDVWSQHGEVAAPRRFVRWWEDELRAVVFAAGWDVETVDRFDGDRGERWLSVSATRRA